MSTKGVPRVRSATQADVDSFRRLGKAYLKQLQEEHERNVRVLKAAIEAIIGPLK